MTLTDALPKMEKREQITCLLEVPDGEVCGLLALDAAGPEDQPALVADHEGVLAALALGLGRPPQQAAVTASLRTHVEGPVEKPHGRAESPGPRRPPRPRGLGGGDTGRRSCLF